MRASDGPSRKTFEQWNTPGPWMRTPWWMVWRPKWRRTKALIHTYPDLFYQRYDFATDADFLTMDAQ